MDERGPATVLERTDERDYLCVDRFLRSVVDARALKTAFELRLIDRLAAAPAPLTKVVADGPGEARGLRLLLALLQTSRVVEQSDGRVALTPEFRAALRYRDLLETKLAYAEFVLPDFSELFTAAIRNPEGFFRQSRTFGLFAYDRAQGDSVEDVEATRRWMRLTTCLTKYETPVCLHHHDCSRYGRMLDIGGNSGEFALQICRRHPGLSATVLDLPLVCKIGRAHVAGQPEGARIDFVEGSALTDPLPAGRDLVTFKSMLHDWPDAEARRLLGRGAEALKPGGTLLIFERGPVPTDDVPYSLIPFLLFFRSFRGPALYAEQLATLGFVDVDVRRVDLEMPFYLVTGRKPA